MLSELINHLWQSTIFAGGIAVLTLLLRRHTAGIRFGLWLAASMKFLVPLALLAALGRHIPRHATNLDRVSVAPRVLGTVIDGIVAPMSAPTHVLGTASAVTASVHPFLDILGILWACGVLVIAAYWLVGWSRIRRAIGASRQIAIDFPIPVRASSVIQEPAVAGVVRPILLVPDGIEDWLSREQLRAVLAHERCHVRRHDNLTAALHMVVKAVFWFHPLVWWLETRLIAERESACDEEVLDSGSDAEDYAEGILRVCQHYLASPLPCAAGVGGGNLTRRIEFILNRPRPVRFGVLQMILLGGMAGVVVAEPIVTGHLAAPLAQGQDSSRPVLGDYVAVPPADTGRSDGKDLIVAAANGNLAEVRSLLQKGVAVDFQEFNGAYTALAQAAQRGREPAVVQELLAHGAQVERRRGGGDTALILAGGSGNVSIVEELLNAGAQVNDEDDGGVTALMMASQSGHQGAVLLLLSSGADVHRELKNGETALELAARGGHDRVVRLLLDSGADFRHRRFDGQTALDLAAQGRQVDVVQTLLERGARSR